MKKIVPRLLVVSSQILIGALFLIFTVSGIREVNYKVNSKDIDKLSKFVYKEQSSDKIENNKKEEIKESVSITEKQENIFSNKSNKLDIEKKEEIKIEVKDEVKQEIKEEIKEEVKEEIKVPEEKVEDNFFMDKQVISTYTGILTGYGPDCVGCGNFKTNKVSTASGYHIANIVDGVAQPAFTITYNDNEFGEVRIVAGDSTLPFKSIVRITIPNQDPIIAIVLDRGSTVGFDNCRSPKGCLTNFDLLYASESDSLGKTHNVKFDMLRIGA